MTNRADQIVARALQHLSDIKTAMHTTMEPGNGCPCQAQSGKVDLLIVSDSSHSNELNLTLINKIKDQAIASIDCVDDARVHFLPVTYQAPTIDVKIGNGQTETVTSVWGHLLNLGVSPENIRHNHNEDIGPAVSPPPSPLARGRVSGDLRHRR
ncbi:MAG: hypothetical protein R3F14_00900 [Polyangiaceae bacterium]